MFTAEDIKHAKAFMFETFYKHYLLYEFAFRPKVEMVFKVKPIISPLPDKAVLNNDVIVEDPYSIPLLSNYLPDKPVEENEDEVTG